ncbi:MAG: hypothetical protein A3E25_17950 [Burkholderiales bacterium RIFCSPHIGHO2_12_FULL_69_20]|nr:MAG: hypothetical protein A3E25_17950 [Burkholderiales bacterium RIFCSPHIGHO2_12_FULL_69_20]
MIFVTVGSQMAFDRLIRAVDQWAAARIDRVDVLAQVGQGAYATKAIRTVHSLTPAQFRQACEDADVVVAHAGMGSVLTALELGRPIVLLPRRGELQETRNDHQLATARWLATRQGVLVAEHEDQLAGLIEKALVLRAAPMAISSQASATLLGALDQFIAGGLA